MNVRFLACRFYDYCNGNCKERMDDLCSQWPDIHIDKIDRMVDDREDCIRENVQGITD